MAISVFILRLLLAFALGALIGVERQVRQKSAGLRTNTLVCIGAAGFVLMSYQIGGTAVGRVASYVVSGIGFLGAGVIMKDGFSIRGLNTAATIWCSASVGSMCGVGLWKEAIVMTVLIVGAHLLLRPLGSVINKLSFESESDSSEVHYEIIVGCKEEVENAIRVMVLQQLKSQKDLQMRSLKSSDNGNPAFSYLKFEIYCIGRKDEVLEQITKKVSLEFGVSEVSWELTTY
ncbi:MULTISPECIES: MgtC/SapB family protein [Myroides]|uniref:Protein MgtC n=1 Tax=Myroides albus TaxID=2562892 RepID=A0A6I3LEH9_9FLAO|nr:MULTISPECIES: MgtC/SapB family protein [Myroides]MTG96623.1 MgtC/SapB family protein [Myroides albus]MVX35254.1 MgtC/SapB family protein [Myroides sp. LoEW2-1]UVD80964.1 MgtC/SapB family protein [Myroides albus]